jgi:hypothetical protein
MVHYSYYFWYLEDIFLIVSSLFMIRQGFRDATFPMPFLPTILLTTHQFWFSFYTSKVYTMTQIYFFFQCILLGQLMAYGPREFFGGYRLPFYGMLATCLLPCLGIMVTIIDEEGRKFSNNQLWYGIMFVTNVSFVHMLLSRGDARGQHMGAAITKCIAMLAAWVYQHKGVCLYFSMGAIVADLVYIGLLYLCLEDPQAFRQWRLFLLSNERGNVGGGMLDNGGNGGSNSIHNNGDNTHTNPLLFTKNPMGSIQYERAPMMDHTDATERTETSFEMLNNSL